MNLEVCVEEWRFRTPLRIARETMHVLRLVIVELFDGWHRGRGEGIGVQYDGETPQSIAAQVEALRPRIAAGLDRETLMQILPPGGARNALDCALWDLEAKAAQRPAWALAGGTQCDVLTTAFTIGLGSLTEIRDAARQASSLPLIKLKLDATNHLSLVEAVRGQCPDVRIIVDANESWTLDQLNALAPSLAEMNVSLIEQPLPTERQADLARYSGTIPLAADEACIDRGSLPEILGRYQYINIKLDKTGGLTEALALADEARGHGLRLMVGCMAGTSLSMAPAMIVGQMADFVDLDGPLLLNDDRPYPIQYDRGRMSVPDARLWG